MYCLIETANANGLKPYEYLRYLFDQLPLYKTQPDYEKLMPQYTGSNIVGSFVVWV